MKCPHCGHEWQPEKPPYEYSGYLKPWLNEILEYLKAGRHPNFIAIDILARKDFVAPENWDGGPHGYWPRRNVEEREAAATAIIRNIASKYGLIKRKNAFRDREIASAREEHAWILRAEGLTLREIGERLGISKDRCRQLIWKCGRRNIRQNRTRFYFNDCQKTERAKHIFTIQANSG